MDPSLIGRVQGLSSIDIAALHEFLLHFKDSDPISIRSIRQRFREVAAEQHLQLTDERGCISLVFSFLDPELGPDPYENFINICNEAEILLAYDDQDLPNIREMSDDELTGLSLTAELMHAMENQALSFDRRKLIGDSLSTWRAQIQHIREMEICADQFYRRKLTRRALSHINNYAIWFNHRYMPELLRREVLFVKWLDRRIWQRWLLKWILEHRALVLMRYKDNKLMLETFGKIRTRIKQYQEQHQIAINVDDRKLFTGVMMLWHEKAMKKREERIFNEKLAGLRYNTIVRKWVRVWKRRVWISKLRARYDSFCGRYDRRLAERALRMMMEKVQKIREDEKIADAFAERKAEERARRIAHGALTKMYEQTAQTKENEEIADKVYEKNLSDRLGLLAVDGNWRRKVREIHEMGERADEYREIKTQEVAANALRNMRQQTFVHQRREQDADAFYERGTKRIAKGFLEVWRQKAAERRGQRAAAAPMTPAARRVQLLNSQAYTPAVDPTGDHVTHDEPVTLMTPAYPPVAGAAEEDDEEDE